MLLHLDEFLQFPVDPLEDVVDEKVVAELDDLDLVVAGELVEGRAAAGGGRLAAHRGGRQASTAATPAAPGRQGHGRVGQRNLWTLGGRAKKGNLRAVAETMTEFVQDDESLTVLTGPYHGLPKGKGLTNPCCKCSEELPRQRTFEATFHAIILGSSVDSSDYSLSNDPHFHIHPFCV